MLLRLFLLLAVLGTTSGPAAAQRGGFPEHRAANPGAPPVTAATLMESERFWPTLVRLRRDVEIAGAASPLRSGMLGVLIRVESSDVARVDLGRNGLHSVPIEATDLLEGAEKVRRGEIEKSLPNLVWAIGSRLVDSSLAIPRALPLVDAYHQGAFLCVFADPASEDFGSLVRSISPLSRRGGLLTVLFADGPHPNAQLHRRLRALEWPAAFVVDHNAEGYARVLLPEGLAQPALMLLTPEGRLLFEAPWTPGTVHGLLDAVDGYLGGPPRKKASLSAP